MDNLLILLAMVRDGLCYVVENLGKLMQFWPGIVMLKDTINDVN